MQRALLIIGFALAAAVFALWLSGGLAFVQAWILAGQREIQSALAAAVRKIKTGQPGALMALLTVCFTFGVLHAAGPGHGKVVIGGFGMGGGFRCCRCPRYRSLQAWRKQASRWPLFARV